MAERRKGSPRKTASRKTVPRKTAGKSTTRKSAAKKASKAGAGRKKAGARKATVRKWSQGVTEQSDALDLKQGVFKLRDPKKIAASLKRSAEQSSRRKASPFRSALSMLTFYINRAGDNLPKAQRSRLDKAKDELRVLFGRDG